MPTELAYREFTSYVVITGTSIGNATTIVTAPAVSLDGSTPIIVEFGSPFVEFQGTGTQLYLNLYDGGASVGTMSRFLSFPNATLIPTVNRWRLTPSAGSHTYSVRGYGSPTVNVFGGSGDRAPGYIRIIKVY